MRASLAPTALALACAVALLGGTAGAVGAVASGPARLRLAGVDVSSYQHWTSLDWAKVKAAGQDFAFVKATEDTGYANPYFAADWAGLGAVGMARGAYHFARPNRVAGSAAAQAGYFVQVAGLAHDPGALAPMFDMEDAGGLTPTELVAWSKAWLGTVQALTGRRPIIYTYAYFWRTAMGDSQAFTAYPLFLADYHDLTGTTAPRPGMPGGWATWTFWQYSDVGKVPGISGSVDMDRYNGSSVWSATWGRSVAPPVQVAVLPLASYQGQLLQIGSVGPAVTALQRLIGADPDGAFGQMTAASLRVFQTAHGVLASGVTDAATWAVLVPAAVTPSPSPVTSPPPLPVPVPVPVPVPAPVPVPVTLPVLKPAPAPVIYPLAPYKGQLLHIGSVGPAVVALQKKLGAFADGGFGPMTRASLVAFQRTHGVPQTGVTDARTWSRLVPVAVAKPVSPLARYRLTVLRVGSGGPAVTALQKRLRVGADGQFGPLTRAAVLSYQRTRRLPVTGVVTAVTWDALIAGR